MPYVGWAVARCAGGVDNAAGGFVRGIPIVSAEAAAAAAAEAAAEPGTPAGRPGNPEAIAYAAIYLASDEAAFVHGSVLDVDGGRTTTAVIAR